MSDTTHTLMMDVIENINNSIVPVHLPFEYQSFLTPDVINGVIDAMNFNKNFKIYTYYDITPLEYFEGIQMGDSITYYPFDIEPEILANSEKLPVDFVFTLDNTSIYYYGSVTLSRKLLDIEKLNRKHRYFHALGFEPVAIKNIDGVFKFSGSFYTKKDFYPTAQSSSWAKEHYPINVKKMDLDAYPDETTLRKAFGFSPRQELNPDGSINYGDYLFSKGSKKNLDGVLHSVIKIFSSLNNDGLIITPGADGVVLPYHNKVLYYANPLGGYYDNYYNVFDFNGGGVDLNTYKNFINGTAYASGFQVVWFSDTEFWITLKYKLVYTDTRLPVVVEPTVCCLAQCFGITQ